MRYGIFYNMERIIITGTDGFVGQNLLIKLKETNRDILEINENIFDNPDWVIELLNVLNSFAPTVIFHVGACSDTLETNANYMMTRNYEFTRILSDYCNWNKSKLVYSSSAANYGTNSLYPSNLYGWSKYVAEQYVNKCGGISLRYFNVYGPLENKKGKMASVAYQMIEKHKQGDEILLFPGKPRRDFVYVDDVVSANIYAFENYETLNGKYYDVGSGDARTFEDVLNILGFDFTYHEENKVPIGYQFYTKSNKNKWMMGWEPKFNLELGLQDYKEKLN
jgi:ADP-L-glycero-D-manno-heptose 6-epimerase